MKLINKFWKNQCPEHLLCYRDTASVDSIRKLYQYQAFCRKSTFKNIHFINRAPISISIIIPAYNQWKHTKACLNSIFLTRSNEINYEVILANDASTDDTCYANHFFPGLRLISTPKNVGFLRNCNHAAQHARGRYLLFLNNDTFVLPNWLAKLYQAMESEEQLVMAGSKVLSRWGRISEAGCKISKTGSIRRVGKGASRYSVAYSQSREVDYSSGCSLMVRKSFWDRVGGFDNRYAPAYYEESDLAMTARAMGYRVKYISASEVVHHGYSTYGKRAKSRLDLVKRNRLIFEAKWHQALQDY